MWPPCSLDPLASIGWGLGLVAAAAVFGYGVWTGQRGRGLRAMSGVLGAVFLSLLPPLVTFLFPGLAFWMGGWESRSYDATPFDATVRFVLTRGAALLLAFLPLYVAVNWLEVMQRVARPEPGNPPA